MKTLRIVLGDQISRSLSALRDMDLQQDVVLMMEVREETRYVRHHKQKIVFILSAMRHFAESLVAEGMNVDYVKLDDPDNTGSFTGELQRALKRHKVDRITATEPGEWRVWQMMQSWEAELGLPVDINEDDRFLCSRSQFVQWANGRKSLRMEYFYREMRRKTGWLMQGDQPEGGRWNYDAENRKALPDDIAIPAPDSYAVDAITQQVIDLVNEHFPDHFGELDSFRWAVTRKHALQALQCFISERLPDFGDYQDAMRSGTDFLFHSILSPYLNAGLLEAREVSESVLDAYNKGEIPLHAVEGFIRQIIGWREYMRGIYWHYMPEYASGNFLEANRPLPAFYWTADTEMKCLRETVESTQRNAYAHHIQRLMVTGNFALLAGLRPSEVEEWYLTVYADAFEWVELPNTHGMALHADGGLLGSKPYAASGAYIDRMSNYCSGCRYKPKVKLGDEACPFNYLYWYFLIKNRDKLKTNPRMGMPYRTLDRMSADRVSDITAQSEDFLATLE